MNAKGETTFHDLRTDSEQNWIERQEQLDRAEQTTLPLTPRASTHGATCAKCGRAFTTPGQYRYRGSDGAPICRDARACAVRAEEKHGK